MSAAQTLSVRDKARREFPKGVRMARPGDEAGLWTLFLKGHAEDAHGEPDKDHVMTVFAKACRGDGLVIAVVESASGLDGAIGFIPEKAWYASTDPKNYYNTNILFYVDSAHRSLRTAMALFRFAEWWEQETGLPTFMTLAPRNDFERKKKLFSRFWPEVGAIYSVGSAEGRLMLS